ncbi:hypothetical protein LZC95_44080 [Pendulispora brunnea]|uniref:DUF8173 domain-containing protein n=1 Tax=Pendulispora brunnea TaxID=2905690 RepID=A0ABZ2K3Z3_9BACT
MRQTKQETVMKYGFGFLAFVLSTTVLCGTAFASVKREGNWPSEEKKISLDVSNALKTDAVRRIAAAAGWNVVVHAPPGDLVDIHVKDLPPTKVLELVLNDGNYVAQREGNLIVISREMGPGAAGVPPVPPVPAVPGVPPIPPVPPVFGNDDPNPDPSNGVEEEDEDAPPKPHPGKKKHHGKSNDRIITGGSARVEKGDVVDDLVVMGGSVDVYGEVRGDLAVMGGSATVHDGGHVLGDVSAIGGKVRLESGACVDGEVGVVGGMVDQQPGAKVGNESSSPPEKPQGKKGWIIPGVSWPGQNEEHRPWYKSLAEHVSDAVEHTALLFVLGAVLLSLATRRMDLLRTEIAARPMRSFAIGILATLATAVGLVALCVTVIGIPIAIVGVLVGAFGIYAGICAALATLGKGLVAHRTENQHVHLAVGCAVFLILSALPLVGWITVAVVGLIGFGALVATRLAGFAEKKAPMRSTPVPGEGPYRSSP